MKLFITMIDKMFGKTYIAFYFRGMFLSVVLGAP